MSLNLKKIRTQKGITQEELATKCGVSQQAVCNYEAGIREPSLYTVKRIASTLDCTVDELLAEDEMETSCER